MPAAWKRISPEMPPAGQIQAVKAKKHVTIFSRSPSAPGAGTQKIRTAFAVCAKETRDISSRQERNAKMETCMDAKGLRDNIHDRKSHGKYSGLRGKFYVNGVLSDTKPQGH